MVISGLSVKFRLFPKCWSTVMFITIALQDAGLQNTVIWPVSLAFSIAVLDTTYETYGRSISKLVFTNYWQRQYCIRVIWLIMAVLSKWVVPNRWGEMRRALVVVRGVGAGRFMEPWETLQPQYQKHQWQKSTSAHIVGTAPVCPSACSATYVLTRERSPSVARIALHAPLARPHSSHTSRVILEKNLSHVPFAPSLHDRRATCPDTLSPIIWGIHHSENRLERQELEEELRIGIMWLLILLMSCSCVLLSVSRYLSRSSEKHLVLNVSLE